MISAKFDAYDLYPQFLFEEQDLLRAQALLQETEIWLKDRIYALTQEIVNTVITGTPDEKDELISKTNFMKGKIDAYEELLNNSRDAKYKLQAASQG